MNLKRFIADYPDFPEPGIIFRDIFPVLRDPKALMDAIQKMRRNILCDFHHIDRVIAPESRGFLFGMPLAYILHVGFIPARKPGKLPGEVISQEYTLEYGTNSIEISAGSINPGDNVVIVDDLLATGGTIKAITDLVEKQGGKVVHIATFIELEALKGRELLKGYDVSSVITY